MNDILIRGMTKNHHFKIAFVSYTGVAEEARKTHNTEPLATVVMTRFIGSALLLSTGLKEKEQYSFTLSTNGPIKSMACDVNSIGNIRVYPSNPNAHLVDNMGKLDIKAAINGGYLTAYKWRQDQKEPYTSQIELIYNSVAQDFTNYLTKSEQIPSAIALGEYVNRDGSLSCAGGILIQALPDATPDEIGFLETTINLKPTLVEMFLEDFTIEMIFDQFLGIMGWEIFSEYKPSFICNCEREKVERALISIGKSELTEISKIEEKIIVTCEYCRKDYIFTKDELIKIINAL